MAGESQYFAKRGFQEQLQSQIEKDEQRHVQLTVPLATEIPVIDLRRLVAASTEADLSELRSALTSWGCFQVSRSSIALALYLKVINL